LILAGCIYCIDNDILKKLATFDLFDQTLALFNASRQQVNILGTAQYKFQKDLDKLKKGKVRSHKDNFANYEKTIELAKCLPQMVQSNVKMGLFQELSGIEGADQGEAISTSYVVETIQQDKSAQVSILTGDKNYLRALANVEIPIVQASLTHNLWCLEQIILKNIETHGFEFVRDKVVPFRECDQAIKAVFGSSSMSTPKNSLAALESYIKELREETGNLLHPYPNQ